MVKMDWIIFEKLMVILFECMFLTLSDRSIKVTDNKKGRWGDRVRLTEVKITVIKRKTISRL